MARLDIRDRVGHRIGWIDDRDNEQVAYSATGHRLGRYDKRTNTTYDAVGHRVGTGNHLSTLITDSAR